MRPLFALIPVACLLAIALPTTAQLPRIQEIDLYGLRKVSAESILQAGKLRTGQPLPPSKGELEEAIEKVPGVLRARVEVKCCEDQGAILFVGIEERDGPHVEFHSEPSGNATPPPGMMEAYQKFLDALRRSGSQSGRDPALSESEEQFATLANGNLLLVRDALYNGAEPEERAAAAIVIGYATRKNEIMPDLQYALRDPDESVRSNAIRSLHASVVTEDGGTPGIPVPVGALVDLLESVVLSDRLEAADLLVTLTNDGNREPLTLMRTRALRSLVEMARWESLRYAIRPYILVGRIAGFSEDDIIKWWSSGQREHVIQKALVLPSAGTKAAPRKLAPKQ
jgi:hypothetical protein